MLLEDGFWRIRHMEKDLPSKKAVPAKIERDWKVSGDKIFYRGTLYNLKGINYYPQATPWDMFGEAFNIDTIGRDFKIIKNAGLNTIRIFIPYEDFGKAEVKEEKLAMLKETLNMAEENGLKTVITLFDFYGDYSIMDWTLTHEHARQIVSRFKDHPAIMAWDVKNEPDLDFESRGEERVVNWLKFLIWQIRKADPNHLITIGWSAPEAATTLKDAVDLVSFHYYKDIEKLSQDYKVLTQKISKPLVLQEYGISSYKGLWNPFGNNEDDQADYHHNMQDFFEEKNLSYMSWTLYDFSKIPTTVVGRLPWRKAMQKKFGFIDQKGRKKKSFKYISSE